MDFILIDSSSKKQYAAPSWTSALHQSYKLCFGTQNIFASHAENYFVLSFKQLTRSIHDTRKNVYMSITESLHPAGILLKGIPGKFDDEYGCHT
jgi:hypothetical protein